MPPDATPDRPEPLTLEEREELLDEALTSTTGRAVQGVYLQSLVLKRWFGDVAREDLLEARREAPDGGMETAQRAIDELPEEERAELLERATHLFRVGCMEAIVQMEHVALGLWEDPRSIDAEAVAGFAATPLVARGERMLGELDN